MKKKKWFFIIGLLILVSIVLVAVGLKYFPLNKVVSIPSSSETDFTNSQKIHSSAPHSLFFDFEMAKGKETPDGFYKGIAHTGQFSAKAFGQNSFGASIERKAKEIGPENLKSISLSAWVYVFPTSKEVKGTLVFAASNELGVNICWKGVGLSGPGIPKGKWFKISGNLDLSEVKFKPDYKLQVYFWNNSPTDILVDDYYMVFGGPAERRGDSALVDMTKRVRFISRFNDPPFPAFIMEKEKTLRKMSEVKASDNLLAGDFLNNSGGQEVLLVIKPGARPFLLFFCKDSPGIKKVSLQIPAEAMPFFSSGKIWKGKFISGQGEQLLLYSEKGLLLGQFTNLKPPGTLSSSDETAFKVLWKTTSNQLSGQPMQQNPLIFPGDLNKDGITELLLLTERGYWKMLKYDPGNKEGWKIIMEGDRNPVREWDPAIYNIGISIGRFFPEYNQDFLLTIVKNKGSGKVDYSLRWFNPASGKFEPRFNEKNDYFGKIFGLDTLKPTDQFFIGDAGSGQGRKIFRYNRDWRFDLKQLKFNDTTYQILGNLDFHGYEKDHNPKYYEQLQIIPGKFSDPEASSFFVIGSNKKESDNLPDFIALYKIPQNQSE